MSATAQGAPPPCETASHNRWLLLFCAAFVLSAAICAPLLLKRGFPRNTENYKFWVRLVTLEGIESGYSGLYPRGYVNYPPVVLYPLKIVGHTYQTFVDPAFDNDRMLVSQELTAGLKTVSVGFHLALGLAIFLLLRARYGVKPASIAGSLYLLSPPVILDVAWWGQPDALHSLWVVLGLGLLAAGRWRTSWIAAGLAALSKPQPWVLLPLLVSAQARLGGWRQVVLGAAIAAATCAVVLAPFIVTGRLGQFLTLPAQLLGIMPEVTVMPGRHVVLPDVSLKAHNLGWLLTEGRVPFVQDNRRVLGPVTYRQLGNALVLAVVLFVFWRSWREPPDSLFLLAAYQTFGWFCLTTRAHENHAFMVLPLLLMAAPARRSAWALFGLLSLTILLNIVLHDPLTERSLRTIISPAMQWNLQMLNSAANLLILATWTVLLIRPGLPIRHAAEQPDAPSDPRGAPAAAHG